MDFAKALVVVVGLVVVLPLAIIGLALVGPVGWIAGAVLLPLATLGTILWVGRDRPGDGVPPGGTER
jgi:ATP/ADP translocase